MLASTLAALVILAAAAYLDARYPRAASYSEPYDPCRLSEDRVRKLWVTAALSGRDETERTRVAADLVRQSENLCRENYNQPIVPLPPELQRLVR